MEEKKPTNTELVTSGYLDVDFQEEFIAELIIDSRFADNVILYVQTDNFENEQMRSIVGIIKNFYEKYHRVPNFKELSSEVKTFVKNEINQELQLKLIEKFKEFRGGNMFVQDRSENFFLQQNMLRAIAEINRIVAKGDVTNYPKCEEILRKVFVQHNRNDIGTYLFDGLKEVYEPNYRNPIPLGLPGLDYVLNGGLAPGELMLLIAPTGVGKAQGLSEPILTPNGWITMGDIKVDDEVIGSNGEAQKVLGVFPQGKRSIYKVSFSDSTEAYCDAEHLWSVNTLNMRERKTHLQGKRIYQPNNKYITLKTIDMMNNVIGHHNRKNYRLPLIKPINFNDVDVKIEPYLLGVLIGDGCFTEHQQCPTITSGDDEICDTLSKDINFSSIGQYRKTCKVIRFKTTLRDFLKEYNLFGKTSDEKFIPKEYKYNSKEKRIELLQGLMDSDGYISKEGGCQYYTTSLRLKDDFRELVLSLGGTVKIKTKNPTYKYLNILKDGKEVYIISFSFNNDIIPFKLTRKIERYKPRTKYINQKFISSITYSHEEEAQCIKVSNEDQLYVTRDYVLTHNTTLSTFVASNIMRSGKKVLQMFFEDTEKQIKQKHAACLHNLKMEELQYHKEECITKDEIYENEFGQNLILKKFRSGTTYVSTIRNYLNKLKTIGFVPDFLILDYVDKVSAEKGARFASKYEAQDEIIGQLESLVDEFKVPCLTFSQSNRSGVGAEKVTSKEIGGSFGRAQIVHVLGSISKTDEQKLAGIATIEIEKSRVGDAPKRFVDIHFDNQKVQIDIPEQLGKTNVGYLEFMVQKETGKTQEDFVREAKATILQQRQDNKDAEDRRMGNPTIKELEEDTAHIMLNQQTLEDNFNGEAQIVEFEEIATEEISAMEEETETQKVIHDVEDFVVEEIEQEVIVEETPIENQQPEEIDYVKLAKQEILRNKGLIH